MHISGKTRHKIEKAVANANKKYGKILRWIPQVLIILAILDIFLYIHYVITHSNEENIINTQKYDYINNGWEITFDDGTTENIALPYVTAEKIPAYKVITLKNKLPATIESHDWLCLRAVHQNVKVFIDGKLRKNFVQEEDFIYKDDIASRYLFVPLSEQDAGKQVTLEFVNFQYVTRSYSEVFFGDKIGIISRIIKAERVSFILAIILLIIGFMAVFLGVAVRYHSNNTLQLDHVGWFLVLLSIWDLTQSDFRDVLFANIKDISIVPFMIMIIICVPLAMYFDGITKRRYTVFYSIYEIGSLCYLVYCGIQQALGIKEYREHMLGLFIWAYVFVLMFCISVYLDAKMKLLKTYFSIFIGYLSLATLGVVQYIVILLNLSKPDGTFIMIGGAIFAMVAAFHSASVFITMDSDKIAALQIADSKAQFLANMSHEIRTPINAVLGMNEAILRESDDKNVLGYATDVDQAGHLLLSLINDILDFSKLDSGKMELIEAEYNLRALVMACYNMIEKRAQNKNLDIVIDVDENLPARFIGDEVRIQQVITNMLTNAVKYTKEGRVGLKVFEAEENGEMHLKFYVSDTGMGIKEEDKDKLFSAFQRVDEEKNKHIEGTGLGLAITSHLVKLMGGSITVESTYGSGSVFMVSIPAKPATDEKIGKFSLDVHAVGDKRRDKTDLFLAPTARILVVDDIQVNLRVAVSLLRRTEMTIDTALSGDECLELTLKNKYDVILLDHMMPDKDGIQTFKELKAQKDGLNNKTPVIMLTANAVAGAKDEYMDEGFTDYLSKPFSAKEVQKTLIKHIPAEKIQEAPSAE